MRSPDIFNDRVWVAYAIDKLIAYSYLSYPQVGFVTTGYTATAREWRGQGVARAVKLESAAQAMSLGVDRIRTDNDLENLAIIHINEAMGYQAFPGLVTHMKGLV
jgi:mycothiol synthase